MLKRSCWKGVFCFKGKLWRNKDMSFIGHTPVRSYVLTSHLATGGKIFVQNVNRKKEERAVQLTPSRLGYSLKTFVLSKKGGDIHSKGKKGIDKKKGRAGKK